MEITGLKDLIGLVIIFGLMVRGSFAFADDITRWLFRRIPERWSYDSGSFRVEVKKTAPQ